MDKNNFLKLGTCHKPHGIKGGFSFHLYNSQDSTLKKKSKIHLIPMGSSSIAPEGEEFSIKLIQFAKKSICYLEGVEDRNVVESMLPFEIWIERSKLPKLTKDEFYLEDLIGLKLINADKAECGFVKNYYDNGAQIVLLLELPSGELELPFIDNFFPEINWKKKEMSFIAPEYE